MKGCIKHRHLRYLAAEKFISGSYSLEVARIVQGGKIDTVFDSLDYFRSDQCRLREEFASMDYPMANRVLLRFSDPGYCRLLY